MKNQTFWYPLIISTIYLAADKVVWGGVWLAVTAGVIWLNRR